MSEPPSRIAWLKSGLATLAGTGLSETEKLSTILLVGGFVRSEAPLVTDVNATFRAAGATPVQARLGPSAAQDLPPRP